MKAYALFSLLFVAIVIPSVNSQNLHTRHAPLPCLNKKFTVVAHILRDSLGELGIDEPVIQGDIEALNGAFQPICASFELCDIRIIDNFQYDTISNNEIRELQNQFNLQRRINIYYINEIRREDDPMRPCGVASLGGIRQPLRSAVLIRKDCTGGGTAIHEMGHFFGLTHTFEGNGIELVDGSNCTTAGDQVCDTPADPYDPAEPVSDYVDIENDCRFISTKVDANGQFYEPDVGNYMSYYPDLCSCGFTYGQYVKMANQYLSSSIKFW